ncbi:hypothetical protein IMZ48_21525 [Candidatus Bathyarchaeota archaeon]|nr:hypothetical protein [Candidatus Bathyarchaeota archaeon]
MPPSSGPPPPLARPRQPSREPDLSPVDKCWGELFDANGKATKRLGQVLRGLASYLVSSPGPPSSLRETYTGHRSHKPPRWKASSSPPANYPPSTRSSPSTTNPTPIPVRPCPTPILPYPQTYLTKA